MSLHCTVPAHRSKKNLKTDGNHGGTLPHCFACSSQSQERATYIHKADESPRAVSHLQNSTSICSGCFNARTEAAPGICALHAHTTQIRSYLQREVGNICDQHSSESIGDSKVIRWPQRLAAQIVKMEAGDTFGRQPHLHHTTWSIYYYSRKVRSFFVPWC